MIIVPLTQGKIALIDNEDGPLVLQHKWHARLAYNTWYARTWIGTTYTRQKVGMHTLIMDTPEGKQIDHINGDGLDNRRCNLRITDTKGNARNRHHPRGVSKHMGVVLHSSGKWQATRNHRYLGLFDTEEAAAQAYQEAVE